MNFDDIQIPPYQHRPINSGLEQVHTPPRSIRLTSSAPGLVDLRCDGGSEPAVTVLGLTWSQAATLGEAWLAGGGR